MSNLGKILSADPSIMPRMTRHGVDMLMLSQVNKQARQQIHGSAMDLLLHQPYVKCQKQPEVQWLAARPPWFAPVVLQALARCGQRLTPRQYCALSEFLRHVQASPAAINAYQLAATDKPFFDRVAPKVEARVKWNQALTSNNVWDKIDRPRPEARSWAREFFVRSAEKRIVPQRFFSWAPGIMLAAIIMQRLPSRLVSNRWGELFGVCLGVTTGLLLGSVCFVLALNPLLHLRFARSNQRAIQDEYSSGLYSQQMLDRVWPGLANPYEGEKKAEKNSWPIRKRPWPKHCPPTAGKIHRPLLRRVSMTQQTSGPSTLIDDPPLYELDQLDVISSFYAGVRPNYPADRLVRWMAD